jgi:hypothetical protein
MLRFVSQSSHGGSFTASFGFCIFSLCLDQLVSTVYRAMGPFARAKVKLTQSHKVKRELVIPGIDEELPILKMYRKSKMY